jgi:predicted nuclease of predicted toxin-antitoxin system
MRFLADENFPGEAIRQLEKGGHDVVWVRSIAPGIPDADIVAWAARESRIVLTFDKDFGELVWSAGLPMSSGIVLFRLPMPAAGNVGRRPCGSYQRTIRLGGALQCHGARTGAYAPAHGMILVSGLHLS